MAPAHFTDILAGYAHALPALATTLVVVVGLSAIGGLISGRKGDAAAWLTTGWGAACLISLGTTLLPLSLKSAALILAAGAVIGAVVIVRRGGPVLPASTPRVLILALPLLLMAGSMRPSQWDEFSHWLLAGEYLLQVNGFPGPGRPLPVADYPAYPYGMPLIHYLAGLPTGKLVDTAGPIFNFVLLLLAADPVIRAAQGGLDGEARETVPGWAWCGLGILAVTILSPTFVIKVVFTNYADTAQAVALTFFVLSCRRMVLSDDDRAAAWAAARQAGFSGIALIQAKPTGMVLAAAVLLGSAGVALAAGALRRPGRPIALAALVVALIASAHLCWESYIATHLAGGRHAVTTFGKADWTILSPALVSMMHVASNKGGYFGLMAAILVMAWKLRRRPTEGAGGLYLIVAVAFLCNTLFLTIAYVMIFGGYEGRNAASFWRYNMAFGPLAMILAADLGRRLWLRLPAARAKALPALTLAAVALPPLAGTIAQPWMRFDLVAPKADLRRIAPAMAALLPPGSRVFVVDPLENGFYAKMARFELRDHAVLAGDTTVFNAADLADRLERAKPTALWVHTADPTTEAVLGMALPAGASYLLLRDGEGWKKAAEWPFSGYALPHHVDKG